MKTGCRLVRPEWALVFAMPLMGACAATTTMSNRAYLGDGVINLQAQKIDRYTCGPYVMYCDVLSGLSHRCRCSK